MTVFVITAVEPINWQGVYNNNQKILKEQHLCIWIDFDFVLHFLIINYTFTVFFFRSKSNKGMHKVQTIRFESLFNFLFFFIFDISSIQIYLIFNRGGREGSEGSNPYCNKVEIVLKYQTTYQFFSFFFLIICT